MRRICEFAKADDFIFPLTENICKRRGIPSSSVADLFTAVCEECGAMLNSDVLAMQAAMIVTVGQPIIDACRNCGSRRFIGTVIGLDLDEQQILLKDRFFKTLKIPDK